MSEHILSLSYGKDSLACLGAIEQLGWPLDRIVHAEVWATDTIPADLPPMVEFKKKADEIILRRWGIEVEHVFAQKDGVKQTYESIFYRTMKPRKRERERELRTMRGFPGHNWPWCIDRLKTNAIDKNLWIPNRQRTMVQLNAQDAAYTDGQTGGTNTAQENSKNKLFSAGPRTRGGKEIVQYLGIASDEPERIARHTKTGIMLPLVEIGWDEAKCRKWCEENDLLSPIYTTATRGGCWFCHNQGIGQLRLLRKNYPDLWAMMLKWDKDSPVTFKPDGHTVHDFDRRFQLEDEGFVYADDRFRGDMLNEELNYRLF